MSSGEPDFAEPTLEPIFASPEYVAGVQYRLMAMKGRAPSPWARRSLRFRDTINGLVALQPMALLLLLASSLLLLVLGVFFFDGHTRS